MSLFLYLNNCILWLILHIRPLRKIQKATASKIKKAVSSKRQRNSDDSDDVDYASNPSDLAAASSVGDVGDESLEEDAEGVDDDVTDLMGLDLPSRQWTAESYANARSPRVAGIFRGTHSRVAERTRLFPVREDSRKYFSDWADLALRQAYKNTRFRVVRAAGA